MTLEETDLIDMGFLTKEGQHVLVIVDAGTITDETTRFNLFWEKLKVYSHHVMSEEYKKEYPNLTTRDVFIFVVSTEPPTEAMERIRDIGPKGDRVNRIQVRFTTKENLTRDVTTFLDQNRQSLNSKSTPSSSLTEGTYLTKEENILDIDDELHNLVREAIDTGYGLVQEDDIDITPLLVTSSSIVAFPEQKLSEIFPVIQKAFESGSIKHGALVYNGFLTQDGTRTRAMFAEGYEQGVDKVWRFAQLYRPAVKARLFKKGQPPERIGNLKYLPKIAEHRML